MNATMDVGTRRAHSAHPVRNKKAKLCGCSEQDLCDYPIVDTSHPTIGEANESSLASQAYPRSIREKSSVGLDVLAAVGRPLL
jgi:CDGSH-type Zn-finger protein